ncbi:MAG TPA: ABC transporter ATP-binding protein [Candidatus Deferrimicrobiaceae bacterium]|jgi:ATP-binding cassette subfamily B protein
MSGSRDFFLDDRGDDAKPDLALLRRLLPFLAPHKGLVAFALLALALGTACQLAGPWLIRLMVDRHLTPRVFSGAWPLVAAYLAALAGANLFVALQMLAVSVLGQRVILAIRRQMVERLQTLPVAFFDHTPTGRLMTRVTSDVEALQELISSGLVSTFGDAALLLGTAGMLLWLNLRLALVTFAMLPVLLLFVSLLKKSIRDANREVRRRLAHLNAFLQEHVSGIAVVKSFGAEGKAIRAFGVRNDAYAAESVRLTQYYSVYFPGVELLASVTVALLLWQGGGRILAGAITLGTLVAFLEYARRFFDPLKDMSDKYNILQTALSACERIFRVLDGAPSPEYLADAEAAAPPPAPEGAVPAVPAVRAPAVEFRGVWFSYGGEPVLRDVSFAIGEGETGAIVGATGAGKTTILALLIRLYELDRGTILLYGRDIRQIPRETLRRTFALVQQDPFLFSGTVIDNIRAGGEAVDNALAATGVAEFAAAWPKGLDTPVGERGGSLSVGQRQLVAFARALARDPRVLLLDEATSSVDPVTEGALQRALDRLRSGRTALVVAHRLATVLSADRIVVLHKGKVRETGTHAELIAAGGIYARLHALQFGES